MLGTQLGDSSGGWTLLRGYRIGPRKGEPYVLGVLSQVYSRGRYESECVNPGRKKKRRSAHTRDPTVVLRGEKKNQRLAGQVNGSGS